MGSLIQVSPFSSFWFSLGILVILGILLTLGRRLDSAMQLERFGIPIALFVGVVGLLLGPYGAVSVLQEDVMAIWTKLPSPLLTLVFATLMIGRPIPSNKGLWEPVAAQAILALLLGFGQYVVGGLIVLFILLPYLDVDPLMGCLIEIGFEGGHGAAAIMGESFEKLGFSQGLDLGLAMATIGLLASTLLGSGLVIFGKLKGWIAFEEKRHDYIKDEFSDSSLGLFDQFQLLLINLGLTGCAVLFGFLMLLTLRSFEPYVGNIFKEVLLGFPVFPLALIGSLIIRLILEKTNKTNIISPLFLREIGILSTDLLIITAMAGLNLPLLVSNWLPLTILSIGGLVWNLLGMMIFARLLFRNNWFERSITEFGNATGVAASGLLLLRLADPTNNTNTLPIFSIKQLFLQPFLSGGLITVIAPLLIINIGLMQWTELCLAITVILFVLAILFHIDTKQE